MSEIEERINLALSAEPRPREHCAVCDPHRCVHFNDLPAPAKEPFYCCKDTDNPCHPIGDYCSRGRPDTAKEDEKR